MNSLDDNKFAVKDDLADELGLVTQITTKSIETEYGIRCIKETYIR